MLNLSLIDEKKLKDSFRKDIHQVLAYSAFNHMCQKAIIMVYPISNKRVKNEDLYCRHYVQNITTPCSAITAKVHLLGIPFGHGVNMHVINELREIVNSIENNFK